MLIRSVMAAGVDMAMVSGLKDQQLTTEGRVERLRA